ncbi:hypothetical protein HYT52_03410 [Candidatus Woesearchaeota archaeon]|nr:hypothetical protein [Candidatus Woesearchaeota archaeon]
MITEHSVVIQGELPQGAVHKKMEVFYNPVMASHRNIAVLLLNCVSNQEMDIADPLAGSGIRAIRFLKELKKGKIKKLFVNDKKENFVHVFQENLQLNKIEAKETKSKIVIKTQEAELFLLTQQTSDFSGYFDYIDIDPFGTPNPFLSAAVNKIKRDGILAVTATDTAALTGTYPKVTMRKYWARNVRSYLMHEVGLRILIRKVQLQGIQFDKALIPILAYHKDHYFRVYFRSEKGKEKCDAILHQHQFFLLNPNTLEFKTSVYNLEQGWEWMGPLWTGKLFDAALVKKMASENPFPEEKKFLDTLKEESKIDVVGFIDLHVLAKKQGKESSTMDAALKKLKGVRTHFSLQGVKVRSGQKRQKNH